MKAEGATSSAMTPGAARRGPGSRQPPRVGRRPGQVSGLTRETILAAARREFAARGYDGAGVDRIARHARVNKAMIYYHFASKAGLYHAMLRDLFERAGGRLRAVADSSLPPADKLDGIVEQIVGLLTRHADLPPIMMREIAEGARRLDSEMLRAMNGLYRAVVAVVHEGQQAGAFRDAEPLLVYFTLVGPLIMFQGGAPVRRAMARLPDAGNWDCAPDALAAHMKRVLRSLLVHPAVSRPAGSRKPARRASSETHV